MSIKITSMRLALTILAAAFTISACASVQRTLSYPATYADADVWVGAHEYAVWFHETDPTILIQRGPPTQMGQALAQNLTVYAADQSEPEIYWRTAANGVLQQLGCEATEIAGADQMREVTYRCMEGVNVRGEVATRREQWRQGVRLDDPTTPRATTAPY